MKNSFSFPPSPTHIECWKRAPQPPLSMASPSLLIWFLLAPHLAPPEAGHLHPHPPELVTPPTPPGAGYSTHN